MSAYEQLMARRAAKAGKAGNTEEATVTTKDGKTVKVNPVYVNAVKGVGTWIESITQQLSMTSTIFTEARESVREEIATEILAIMDRK